MKIRSLLSAVAAGSLLASFGAFARAEESQDRTPGLIYVVREMKTYYNITEDEARRMNFKDPEGRPLVRVDRIPDGYKPARQADATPGSQDRTPGLIYVVRETRTYYNITEAEARRMNFKDPEGRPLVRVDRIPDGYKRAGQQGDTTPGSRDRTPGLIYVVRETKTYYNITENQARNLGFKDPQGRRLERVDRIPDGYKRGTLSVSGQDKTPGLIYVVRETKTYYNITENEARKMGFKDPEGRRLERVDRIPDGYKQATR